MFAFLLLKNNCLTPLHTWSYGTDSRVCLMSKCESEIITKAWKCRDNEITLKTIILEHVDFWKLMTDIAETFNTAICYPRKFCAFLLCWWRRVIISFLDFILKHFVDRLNWCSQVFSWTYRFTITKIRIMRNVQTRIEYR